MQDLHREVIWRVATHTFLLKECGAVLPWSGHLKRHMLRVWCRICKGKSSEDTYGNTSRRRRKTFFARSVGQYIPQRQVYIMKKSHLAATSLVQDLHREVIWRHIWQHIPERRRKKKKNCKECGQYFPPIQVYIMKKIHLAAKSVLQDLHKEVIWRHIWQHIHNKYFHREVI